MKRIPAIFAAAAIVMGLIAPASFAADDKKYIIKVGSVLADSAASQQALYKLETIVEERTKGAIDVQVFGNSALGNERDLSENVDNGTVQMVYLSPGSMGSALFPELQILDAPWLFKDEKHAMAISRNGDNALTEISKKLEASTNVKILDMWYRAPRHVMTKGKPIRTPADCVGVKLRTPDIKIYFGALEAIGFAVTPIAYAETYSALQTGVVEGVEGPLDLSWGMQFQEVTKYMSLLGWNSGLGPVAVNKHFFASLPQEYQDIIQKAVYECGDYNTTRTIELLDSLTADFKGAGMTFVEPDMEAFYAMIDEIIPKISDIWNDNGNNYYHKIRDYKY